MRLLELCVHALKLVMFQPSNNAKDSSNKPQQTAPQWLRHRFHIRNRMVANCLSELISTFVMLFSITCVVCQAKLSDGKMGDTLQIALSVGFIVTMAVYASFYISGSHVNSAFSFMFLTLGMTRVRDFLLYSFSQILGSFFAFNAAFQLYGDAIRNYSGDFHQIAGQKAMASVALTFPEAYISNYIAFWDSVVATAFIAFLVCVLGDPQNKIPLHIFPILLGIAVFCLIAAFSLNTGLSVNPSANLGARLFLLCRGLGWRELIAYHNYWFWIPLLGPYIGAPLGAYFYHLGLGIHIPSDDGEHVAGADDEDELEGVIVAKISIHSQINHYPGQHASLPAYHGRRHPSLTEEAFFRQRAATHPVSHEPRKSFMVPPEQPPPNNRLSMMNNVNAPAELGKMS